MTNRGTFYNGFLIHSVPHFNPLAFHVLASW